MNLKMKKSSLSEMLEAHLQKRREAKIQRLNNPQIFGKLKEALDYEARWLQKQRMYQLSGSMSSQGIVRFKPVDGSV